MTGETHVPMRTVPVGPGRWTLDQAAGDPTGRVAAAFADGTMPRWRKEALLDDEVDVYMAARGRELRSAYGLTRRQGEVVALDECGWSGVAIAARLGISTSRVAHHLKDGKAKFIPDAAMAAPNTPPRQQSEEDLVTQHHDSSETEVV